MSYLPGRYSFAFFGFQEIFWFNYIYWQNRCLPRSIINTTRFSLGVWNKLIEKSMICRELPVASLMFTVYPSNCRTSRFKVNVKRFAFLLFAYWRYNYMSNCVSKNILIGSHFLCELKNHLPFRHLVKCFKENSKSCCFSGNILLHER